MDNLKTTNRLLLILVVPLVFYLTKVLSFILIPLVSSMFIALLFLPIMRFLRKKGLPKFLNIAIVMVIIFLAARLGFELIRLSGQELLASDATFFEKAQHKINELVYYVNGLIGNEVSTADKSLTRLINKDALMKQLFPTVGFLGSFLTAALMTVFFSVLWLADSIDVQKLLNSTILKKKHTSVKTFRKIEKDLIKFIKVKFLMSAFTGIGTGLFCYFFDVSFPIFWGLFAFFINFVQMVGSFATVILLSIFAFVELEMNSTLLFFMLSITSVQVLFGSILEPVFMGKSFSINIITVLVMLMFWGFIWGIPGLIMAIPITVFLKIILEQFQGTKVIASLLSAETN